VGFFERGKPIITEAQTILGEKYFGKKPYSKGDIFLNLREEQYSADFSLEFFPLK